VAFSDTRNARSRTLSPRLDEASAMGA
jgi:hypothetical protein